jgi:hypothetical protein
MNDPAIPAASPSYALLQAIRDALATPCPRTIGDARGYLDERCNRATEALLQIESALQGADAAAIEWGAGYLRSRCELLELRRNWQAAPEHGNAAGGNR